MLEWAEWTWQRSSHIELLILEANRTLRPTPAHMSAVHYRGTELLSWSGQEFPALILMHSHGWRCNVLVDLSVLGWGLAQGPSP